MKRIAYTIVAILLSLTAYAAGDTDRLEIRNVKTHRSGSELLVTADIVLDSLKLKPNQQLYVTPVVHNGGGSSAVLPAVLVNGRNMHLAYERKTLRKQAALKNVAYEVRRNNGSDQTVQYTASVPFRKWMISRTTGISLAIDTCGCGVKKGTDIIPIDIPSLMPPMRLTYRTPEVSEQPVAIHEGRARVQFEVDSITLHAEPYTCRNGQRIDNVEQLRIIGDSIRYALSDPNAEIASINICGYASPESPYVHNDYLATNRSRALAEYIVKRYNTPADRTTSESVAENWVEFREQVVSATDITETQRKDLLELIDRPTYGSADFDAKERELKTSPKFARLYRSKILPEWFPRLRATKFTITTRLKPMPDEQLAGVMEKTPQMMSLNQMMRVARLHAEGSADFNRIINIALKYYPDDAVANLNAGIAALYEGDDARAAELIAKGGDSPEAENARGVLAIHLGDYDEALRHFRAAGDLPEAVKNRGLLEE